jgi:phosphatidylglycerol:prolipoprotein diacylglycerol transferase
VHPVLLDFQLPVIGEVSFPSYFTLLALGFMAAMWLTTRRARRIGMDEVRVLDTNLWMFFWGLVGARVLHLIADGHFDEYVHMCTDPKLVPAIDAKVASCSSAAQCGYDYLCDLATHRCYPPQDCLAAIKLWRGGFAYYGGFVFAAAFAIYYTRKHAMGFWRTADLAAPAIALGLVFGRVGCFLNGCCYGKATSSALGVVFPRGGSVWREQLKAHLIGGADHALAVHPTQLYEAVGCLALFLLLYFVLVPRARRHGDVFAGLLIGYGLLRSLVEVFRDDDRGVLFGWLSTSQIISVPLVLGGIALLVLGRARPAVAPAS